MDANAIVSKSTKLGAVTRTFKKSMETFSSELNSEIKDIQYAVDSNRGWEGELYNAFREKIVNELNELTQLSKKTVGIANQLEQKAVQYDIIIQKLTNAGGK